jgi:hypothetical protein
VTVGGWESKVSGWRRGEPFPSLQRILDRF